MSNENKIRVLYVQPGKYPEERVIEHTLAAMQALVCGLGEGDFTSLTDEQMKRYERLYHDPVVFVPSRMGIIPMKATPEQYARVMRDTEMRKNAGKEHRSHNER